MFLDLKIKFSVVLEIIIRIPYREKKLMFN